MNSQAAYNAAASAGAMALVTTWSCIAAMQREQESNELDHYQGHQPVSAQAVIAVLEEQAAGQHLELAMNAYTAAGAPLGTDRPQDAAQEQAYAAARDLAGLAALVIRAVTQ